MEQFCWAVAILLCPFPRGNSFSHLAIVFMGGGVNHLRVAICGINWGREGEEGRGGEGRGREKRGGDVRGGEERRGGEEGRRGGKN